MVQVVATAQLTGMFVCFQLVCLTDLENDFINPFDLSSKMNRFVVSKTVTTWPPMAQHSSCREGHVAMCVKWVCRVVTNCG